MQTREQTRQKIAEVMKSSVEPLTATEIAVRAGMSRSLAVKGLSDLREAGHQIKRKRERRRWIYHDEDRYILAASPAVEAPTATSSSPVYWTADMTAVLRAHAWGRSSPAAIAAMLGVSERAVMTKGAKIGIRFNASIERPVRERIADLAAQGWRPSRIARQVGLDPDLVALHLPVSPGRVSSPASPAG